MGEINQLSTFYDKEFYTLVDGAESYQAKKIIPIIYDYYKPKSVVDIGCAHGLYLKEFPVEVDILGVEGSEACKCKLVIPEEKLIIADLTKTLDFGKKYEIALCFEVAEHIDKDWSDMFIENITSFSDTILFTSAPKGQGGHGHINEQSFSYWDKLFSNRGFKEDKVDTAFFVYKFLEINHGGISRTRKDMLCFWIIENFRVMKKLV